CAAGRVRPGQPAARPVRYRRPGRARSDCRRLPGCSAMSGDTGKLRNIGPKSAARLRQVGLRSAADLAATGAVAAFMKVKRAGFKPGLNLLYALEGALLDCHWHDVPEARRQQLLRSE